MQPKAPTTPPKPISQVWRPGLTRLPPLRWPRRALRGCLCRLSALLIAALTRTRVRGVENLPHETALYVTNHLGDADAPLVLSVIPSPPDTLGKMELLWEFPALGRLMDWYGIIWVHRGRVDRRALDCAVRALTDGRCLVIAPEGRYSLTGALERGTGGAALIAMRARVPIVPLAITGSHNRSVYGAFREFRRPPLTLTVGEPFRLTAADEQPRALRLATEQIMRSIAQLLPAEYRGAYRRMY